MTYGKYHLIGCPMSHKCYEQIIGVVALLLIAELYLVKVNPIHLGIELLKPSIGLLDWDHEMSLMRKLSEKTANCQLKFSQLYKFLLILIHLDHWTLLTRFRALF